MPETTTSTGNGGLGGLVIGIIILFIIIVFAIRMAISTSKTRKAAKERFARDSELLRQGIFRSVQGNFSHAAGLPVPVGTLCSLHLTEKGLAVSTSGSNFNITIDKLTSITTKTDTEIQKSKQYVSSAGGAIAGGMMFGAVGAMIGGRAKEKESTVTTIKNYMVVTYKKEDSIDYLLFELSETPMQAHPFTLNFGILTKNRPSETIEL